LTVWPGEKNEDGVLGKALLPFDININEYYDTSLPLVSQFQQLNFILLVQPSKPTITHIPPM
jgi:hypothetical protein